MKLKTLLYPSAGLFFAALLAADSLWERALRFLFPGIPVVLHPRAPLSVMFTEHLMMTGAAAILTVVIGTSAGIIFSRQFFRPLKEFVRSLGALSQTIPPVAILALCVPIFGYGPLPVVTALVLYGMLPVLSGVFTGMDSVPEETREAAFGMGMTAFQILFTVELRLALPAMLAGIRTAVSVSVGTAMIGALTGAGGLGSALSAGLARDNPAFVLEGVIPAVFLALYIDHGLASLERRSYLPASPAT